MAPLYETLVSESVLEMDQGVLDSIKAKKQEELKKLDEKELSRFIAAGKLHCKIDKVSGVLEINRPDAKNSLYQATIKQGDFLLIRKLSRIIDV
ncbi:hypothetical protein ACLB2K_051636 [Fragaria x ananassa]